VAAAGSGQQGQGPKKIIEALHADCTKAVANSFDAKYNQLNGQSYGLANDFDIWTRVLYDLDECELYRTASAEYVSALLNVSQAQYRDAFKGLRLALELTLQGIYLSANLVLLDEWLSSQADTNWQAIVNQDNGVFSPRFCRAFFPELVDDVAAFKSLAETLYREMSECTHGNVPNRIPLPTKIAFDEPTFKLWHEKAGTLRLLVNFALAMRYANNVWGENRDLIGPILLDQLGYVAAIRTDFGGPA
jgi:hypothetical protein